MDTDKTQQDLEAELMARVPLDGESKGNTKLRGELRWKEEDYWTVRNTLIDRGELEKGRGRGGSVRRTVFEDTSVPEELRPDATEKQDERERENILYEPMARVIKETWAVDERFDEVMVEITAQGGRRNTGTWARPDVAVATWSGFLYVPHKQFDLITFEIKPTDNIDIRCVYEALAHRRSATQSYVLLHVPEEAKTPSKKILEDIFAEAKRHGIGVIVAQAPDDYDTWDEEVEPIRNEPSPKLMNDFLAIQFPESKLRKIMKWFR